MSEAVIVRDTSESTVIETADAQRVFIRSSEAGRVISVREDLRIVRGETPVQMLVEKRNEALVFGPQQGPPGADGADLALSMIAGETLSGHRAVFVDTDGKFYYADNTDDSARVVAGIMNSAAMVTALATARFSGVMEEPSWAWIPALPIFLTTNGMLTQTPPLVGYLVEIARALTATSILIEFSTPVLQQ